MATLFYSSHFFFVRKKVFHFAVDTAETTRMVNSAEQNFCEIVYTAGSKQCMCGKCSGIIDNTWSQHCNVNHIVFLTAVNK
jgi:hypothetical protein